MKQFALIAIAMIALVGFTSAQTRNGLVLTDTQAAIDYLYANGLTKFSTTTSFMADKDLRRDEAAAFFARFARDVLGMVPDTTKAECNNFTDLHFGHSDLRGEMIASCQLGLFKGSNGKFMPTTSLSNAHALTVMVRLLDGEQPETGSHWAINYLSRAKVLGITSGLSADNTINLDKNISRGEVARLIEAGSVQGRTNTNHNQEGEVPSKGYIEGSLSYPSDFIPNDMTVCAEDINTTQIYCTNQHIQGNQYTYGVGFMIEVPVGSYQIYQYSPSGNINFKGYYSEMVACGLAAGCPQGLLTVTVGLGQIVSNINPADRYQ